VKVRLALLALALGGFGIGTTEFAAMGTLPQFAQDLLPELWATSHDGAIAKAGILVSAYAFGVVVGAPLIAATLARFPRRRLLVGFVAWFALATLLTSFAPNFELAVAARFFAGLPHGAYFGIAALVAADLMGPGKRGSGVALVLSGLTVANIIGVPLVTWLGQTAGWRASLWVVAGIFVLAALAVAVLVPPQPGDPGATVRRELGALRSGQVWLTLAFGSIGFGGFFAVYSYIAPMITELAGMPATWVPWALVIAGVGMTIGNVVGGRLADRNAIRAVLLTFPAFIVILALTAALGGVPAALVALLFAVSFCSSALSPAIQTRLMDVAGESQTLAAAINHSSLNLGNSLGAALGAGVIAAGYGYRAPALVGVVLGLIGFGIAILAWRLGRRGTNAGYGPAVAETYEDGAGI